MLTMFSTFTTSQSCQCMTDHGVVNRARSLARATSENVFFFSELYLQKPDFCISFEIYVISLLGYAAAAIYNFLLFLLEMFLTVFLIGK